MPIARSHLAALLALVACHASPVDLGAVSVAGVPWAPAKNCVAGDATPGWDVDGDGIPDVCDNCPLLWNPSQNSDAVGTECQQAPGISSWAAFSGRLPIIDFGTAPENPWTGIAVVEQQALQLGLPTSPETSSMTFALPALARATNREIGVIARFQFLTQGTFGLQIIAQTDPGPDADTVDPLVYYCEFNSSIQGYYKAGRSIDCGSECDNQAAESPSLSYQGDLAPNVIFLHVLDSTTSPADGIECSIIGVPDSASPPADAPSDIQAASVPPFAGTTYTVTSVMPYARAGSVVAFYGIDILIP
jgi:hypothetical protein